MSAGWPIVHITKEEAAAALRKHAWPPEDHEEPIDPRQQARVRDAIRAGVDPELLPGLDATVAGVMAAIPEPIVRRIHCRMSFTGADWSLTRALERVESADEIVWADSVLGHDLAVRVGAQIYNFDVPRPERSADGAS